MKKLIFTIALSGLLFASCSSDDTKSSQTQIVYKTSSEEFEILYDMEYAVEYFTEDIVDSENFKTRDKLEMETEDEIKTAESVAYNVWNNVENKVGNVTLICSKFTSPIHTHSLVKIGTTTLSVFGAKQNDGRWTFVIFYAYPNELC